MGSTWREKWNPLPFDAVQGGKLGETFLPTMVKKGRMSWKKISLLLGEMGLKIWGSSAFSEGRSAF